MNQAKKFINLPFCPDLGPILRKMSDFQSQNQRSSARKPQNESHPLSGEASACPGLMPPAFQLTASGGQEGSGDPKKKPAPTLDQPVTLADYAKVAPRQIPDALIQQFGQKVKNIEHLAACADILIVHSPCNAAEIEDIMLRVNAGEEGFEAGKRQILDRVVSLLTHEFADADGKPNTWATRQFGGTTVTNQDNMGAEWLQVGGGGGPRYIVLTQWNDSSKPGEGGQQYTMYKQNPPANGEPGRPPTFQPFGNPLTSRDASGQNNQGHKAHTTGNPIDVTWIQRIINFLSSSSPRSSSQKSWDQKTPIKSITDSSEKEDDLRKAENGREAARNLTLQEEKGVNTHITWRRFDPLEKIMMYSASFSLEGYEKKIREQGRKYFSIVKVDPNDPNKPYFTKDEVEKLIKLKKNDQGEL